MRLAKGFAALGLLCCVVLGAAGGQGPADGLEVREDRPRILFTPERLKYLKAKFEREPFEVRDDSPNARALRYVLTGDKEDAAAAIRSLLEWDVPKGELEGVASNKYRWSPFVPVLYDWLYDEMTEDQRGQFRDRYGEIARIMSEKRWGGPQLPGNNYYAGYMRNEVIFGLATLGETPLADSMLADGLITRWEKSTLPYFAREAAGGLVGEGSQYGRYQVNYVTWMAEALRTASNRNVYRETNWFREFVYHMIYQTTPAETHAKGADEPFWQRFPFGDNHMWNGHAAITATLGDSLRAIASEYNDELVGGHAAAYLEEVEPEVGLFGWIVDDGRTPEAVDYDDLPLDYLATGTNFAYLRSGWGRAATVIMLQLGIPEKCDHFHQALGSFQIVRGGSWLTKESTGYSHRFNGCDARDALAHNTLLFNRRGAAPGHRDGPPRLRAFQTHEKFAHAVVGMTAAYRAQESPKLARDDNPAAGLAVREFIYIRPDILVIFDRMKSTNPDVEKTFVLHLPQKPEIENKGEFLYEGEGSQISAQFVYPKDVSVKLVDEGDIEGEKAHPGYYQWRLEASQSGAKESFFLTVIAIQERFDMTPTCRVSETDETVDLEIMQPGRRIELHLNKVLSDRFGRMIVESAGAEGWLETELLEAVQPITVDADGVHWGEFEFH